MSGKAEPYREESHTVLRSSQCVNTSPPGVLSIIQADENLHHKCSPLHQKKKKKKRNNPTTILREGDLRVLRHSGRRLGRNGHRHECSTDSEAERT